MGFGISVDELLLALSRQKIEIEVSVVNTMILYEKEARENAIRLSGHFRGAGMAVQLQLKDPARTLEEYQAYARRRNFNNLLFLDRSGFTVRVMNLVLDRTEEIPLSEYLK